MVPEPGEQQKARSVRRPRVRSGTSFGHAGAQPTLRGGLRDDAVGARRSASGLWRRVARAARASDAVRRAGRRGCSCEATCALSDVARRPACRSTGAGRKARPAWARPSWLTAARVTARSARRSSAAGRMARPSWQADAGTTSRPARDPSAAGHWARPSWLAAARRHPGQRATPRLPAASATLMADRCEGGFPGQRANPLPQAARRDQHGRGRPG